MVEGMTTVILFEDGTQYIARDVFGCEVDFLNFITLTIENELYRAQISFNKKAKKWLSTDDESNLIFHKDVCVGYKQPVYFEEKA